LSLETSWSLVKNPFERSDETGSVAVPNRPGNFLHAHVALRQQMSRSLQLKLHEPLAQSSAGPFFEQMLESRGAQTEFTREIAHGTRRPGLHPLRDLLQILSVLDLNRHTHSPQLRRTMPSFVRH
jgi:hypothetical protein